jgi:hypothetical protein
MLKWLKPICLFRRYFMAGCVEHVRTMTSSGSSFAFCWHRERIGRQVDGIGRACAVFYGMVIPCFLAYLFAKQHVVMRQSKTFVVWVDGDTKEVTLHLQVLSNEEHLKDLLWAF